MAKRLLTDEQKDLEVRKDIFWRTFFLMFFAGVFAYGFLAQHHLVNTTVTIIIVALCFAGVLFLPGYFYNLGWVREQYDIFQNKKWKTAADTKEKTKAKIYYNVVLFFILSVFSWLASGAAAEFLFNKDNTAKIILQVVFIFLSLVFSIWLTEKKSKQPNQDQD